MKQCFVSIQLYSNLVSDIVFFLANTYQGHVKATARKKQNRHIVFVEFDSVGNAAAAKQAAEQHPTGFCGSCVQFSQKSSSSLPSTAA